MASAATPHHNYTTPQWQALDSQHHLHPFTNHRSLYKKGSRIITRAEGVYLWDSDGNRLLDGMAGLWCVNVGYGRKELADAAREQMLELPYYNNFFQSTHPPAVELAELLAEITPEGLERVFFTGSGSESNDTVIRAVRRYWELLDQPARNIIISRENAYHGSTIAAASLGGMKHMHEQGGLPIPGIAHIQQPYWYEKGGDLSLEEFGLQAAQALEQKILELGAGRVAAFIAEPVQGAGGVIVPPATYWPEIQRICRHYDILLVADEVICGFGRTGCWFGSDYYRIEPDLMPIAKGLSSGYLPIGGVMLSNRVADVLLDFDGEFSHGFTYSGHPVACAVAIANINILKREKLIEQVAQETGPYLQQRWRELGDHPLVGEARGLGFLAGLELVEDKKSRRFFDQRGRVGTLCREICVQNGLVMRAVQDTMVISPSLIMTKAQIDELAERARHCLDLTARELGIG